MTERGPLDFDGDRRDESQPPDRREQGSAAPPPPPPPPARPPGASRYGWFLGIVAVLLLAVVTLNSVSSEGVQSGGPGSGDRMLPFAVPHADRAPTDQDDANVARAAGQGDLGDTPACRVRGPQILNVCELWERGPLVLAMFPANAGRCGEVLDQFERLRERVPGVQFAAVGSRGDRDNLRGDWSFPVGWDKDGAVASVYGLVGCPQITFAERGGGVVETTRRPLSDAELLERARRLAR